VSRARKESGFARVITSLLAALLLVSLVLLAWLVLVYPEGEGAGTGREVAIDLSAEPTVEALASELEASNVVADGWLFAIYARLLGASGHLREGEVLLRDDMSPRTVLLRVALGLGDAHLEVTVPEGLDRFQIAARLDRWGITTEDAFLNAVQDPELLAELSIDAPSAEGYLFPDTYLWSERSDPRELVRRMVENFRARTDGLLSETALSTVADLQYGPHQVLILASVVEEEAAVADERPVIAGVFLNRLRSETFRPRHRLQADPTVSYGCRAMPLAAPSCIGFTGRITRAMLDDAANPYNTYRHGELPPGPISNPGLDAIRAVLEAEHHDYLYFVARGGRRHTFSADLDAHNEAVDVYRGD
jgi:UPF0755 protein